MDKTTISPPDASPPTTLMTTTTAAAAGGCVAVIPWHRGETNHMMKVRGTQGNGGEVENDLQSGGLLLTKNIPLPYCQAVYKNLQTIDVPLNTSRAAKRSGTRLEIRENNYDHHFLYRHETVAALKGS